MKGSRLLNEEDRKVPTLPETSGLPTWAQILVSILVCVATLGVAFKGYFGEKVKPEVKGDPQTTLTLAAASLIDLNQLRHATDSVIELRQAVQALTNALEESTHHSRNGVDTQRELCGRLRALAEEIERSARWTGNRS